jgi:phospholipase/carboxylesterase
MPDFSLVHRTSPPPVGEGPHPGLLLLHGRGTDENDLLPLAREIDERLFAISARAPFHFPWGGYAWYGLDAEGVGYPEEKSLLQSLDLLRRFIGEIVAAYPIDPAKLYVAGFSMGSVMAGTLVLTDPDQVAGGMILSGYLPLHNDLPLKLDEAAGHPLFQAHGTFDTVIPVSFGRETRDYLETTPIDLTYREYPMAHQISGPEVADMRAWVAERLAAGGEHARPQP